jgi:hypothetical protein
VWEKGEKKEEAGKRRGKRRDRASSVMGRIDC